MFLTQIWLDFNRRTKTLTYEFMTDDCHKEDNYFYTTKGESFNCYSNNACFPNKDNELLVGVKLYFTHEGTFDEVLQGMFKDKLTEFMISMLRRNKEQIEKDIEILEL